MTTSTQRIKLEQLAAHPDNPNVMSEALLIKLTRHIERTGQYPPLIVRPHPDEADRFQLLDGHQRAEVLRRLGHTDAACVVWDVDDAQASLLLLTLNRLQGADDPQRRGALLKRLTEQWKVSAVAELVPEESDRIRRLVQSTEPPPAPAPPPDVNDMPQAVTFFLTVAQRQRLLTKLRAVSRDRSAALVQLLELDA